jgi:hypothetical protein
MPEMSLHNQLKEWLRESGDQVEAQVWGYKADIIRGDNIIEIQTGNFPAIREKLRRLLRGYAVTLVYPIPARRWVIRIDGDKKTRRASPKHGRVEDLFSELVYCPELPLNPRFQLMVIFVHEEELLVNDGIGSWRRKRWSILDRRLLAVTERRVFTSLKDYLFLLPDDLPSEFTVQDLVRASGLRIVLARRMIYTLTKMGVTEEVGKNGRAKLYRKNAMR